MNNIFIEPIIEDNNKCECGGELEAEYWWKNGVRGDKTNDLKCSDCGKIYQANEKEEVKVCEFCVDISELEIDYPDEPWHGGIRYCGECDAEYREEYQGKVSAANEKAKLNHPELDLI